MEVASVTTPSTDYIEIQLTRGYAAIIDADDLHKVIGIPFCADVRPNGLVYASTTVGNRSIRLHQIILPNVPDEVDHADGDGLNNRKTNLRPATRSQQMHNTGKLARSTAPFKWITRQKRLKTRPWQGRVLGKHIGYFATAEEAATACDKVALNTMGEYARLNGVEVEISSNHRYDVTKKEFKPNPNGKGRILEYTLSCGHTDWVFGYQAPKIGKHSHCKICAGGK
jgi:hypothetical protein